MRGDWVPTELCFAETESLKKYTAHRLTPQSTVLYCAETYLIFFSINNSLIKRNQIKIIWFVLFFSINNSLIKKEPNRNYWISFFTVPVHSVHCTVDWFFSRRVNHFLTTKKWARSITRTQQCYFLSRALAACKSIIVANTYNTVSCCLPCSQACPSPQICQNL